MKNIKIYGADWCHDTQHIIAHLDRIGVDYEYINIDQDPHARQWVLDMNAGKQKTPTIDADGEILSVPSDTQLDNVLRRHHVLA